jgi:hypothetical protein
MLMAVSRVRGSEKFRVKSSEFFSFLEFGVEFFDVGFADGFVVVVNSFYQFDLFF